MAPRIYLLIGCALLLVGHLVAWQILESGTANPGRGYDVPAAIVFFGSWGLFIWLGYRANRIRIKKPRKKKAAPVEPQPDATPEAS